LAEVIEHDAWILAVARSSFDLVERGFIEMVLTDTATNPVLASSQTAETERPFIPLDIDSLETVQPIKELLNRFEISGTHVTIHDVTSDIGVPVFSVAISGLPGKPDGGGLGAHPDARVALARALTESAQQRLFFGLSRFKKIIPVPKWKRLEWDGLDFFSDTGIKRIFEEINSASHKDILEDIQYMLNALKARGYTRVIAVNLTKPQLDIPVVKVIVPGLVDFWASTAFPPWGMMQSRISRFRTN
jgi:ribosomal protein S12 methylthiotransferase accessory factor